MTLLKHSSPFFSLIATILLLSTATTATISAAFNITRLLGRYPEFGAFNDYLSQTKLADLINHRQTITVLALNNHSVAALAGKPLEVIEKILSGHVVLDFFGVRKLRYIVIDKHSSVFATLFQATGKAVERQGFINVSVADDGVIAFASAVKGSPLVSKLLGSIEVRPYTISVLQVSAPIVPPGVDPNPSPPLQPAPSTAEDTPTEAPEPTSDEEEADAPVADSPKTSGPVADAPEADMLAPSDVPAISPPEPDLDNVGIVVEVPESEKSGSLRAQVRSVVCVGMMIELLSFLGTLV